MADGNGNYEEIIGISLDGDEWASSLNEAQNQWDDFISRLNDSGEDLTLGVDTTGVKSAFADIQSQLAELRDKFSATFDDVAGEASAATDKIAESIGSVTDAAVASEKSQTEATASGVEERTALRKGEAESAAAIAGEIATAQKRVSEESSSSEGGGLFSSMFGSGIAEIAEGIAGLAAFQAEWLLIMAAFRGASEIVSAPFVVLKDGIAFLAQFQERASQISTNLLEHGLFSKDAAENLKLAQLAAEGLEKKLLDVSAQLGLAPEKAQAAFESLNSYGGANLTHNLGDEAQLSGYALAALQSQNPMIQQRQVATQLQKLASGSLKDSDKLPAALGLSAEQLNKMADGARTTHDLLQQIIAAAPGLADRFGSADQRFNALTEKLKLFVEILEGETASPLFDVLISGMQKLDGWLETNKGKIESVASAVGALIGDLAKSFGSLGMSMLSTLTPVIKNLTYNLTTLLGLVTRTANMLAAMHPGKFLSDLPGKGDLRDVQGIANIGQDEGDIASRMWHANDGVDADEKNLKDVLFNGTTDPSMAALEKQITDALNAYKPKPINTSTQESVGQQVSKLREAYTTEIKNITTAGAEFRKQLDADVKDGIATLENATKERATSYDSQAKEIETAGQRYMQAIHGVHGKGAPEAQTKASNDVRSNDRKALDDDINQKRADLEKLNALNQAIQEAQAKSDESLNRAALEHSNQIVGEQQQRGIISPQQAATTKYENASLDIAVQLDALQQQTNAIKGNDSDSVKRRAELGNQQAGLQQRSQFQTEDYQRQQRMFPEQERQQRESMQVDSDKERTAELEAKQHQHLVEGAQPDDLKQDQENVLNSRLQANADETRMLTGKLDALISAIQAAPENAANPAQAVKLNPEVQSMQLKIAALSVDTATIKDLKAGIDNNKGFGNGMANRFFGPKAGSDATHWDNLTDASHSLTSAAGNISQGVGAVEQGYNQSGVGGAVGAGLSEVGQFLPGPAGAVVGAIGSLTSMFSNLFEQAAQNIGREVAKAVDNVMEKYSTGQLSLNQTIQQVQQQINSLISQESGQKGGQSVLNNELPGLQQTLDSLKYQQQQDQWNFTNADVGASSTNQVTQQWLQHWIQINQQVYQYQQAVGSAGNAQIAQYLNEEMQQQQVNLQNQYNQGQTSAINDALQLNQLLQQRNNYEDQYRQQQFQILSADSLQRQGNPAIEAAQKLSLAKSQYDQQTQQLDFEIQGYQQKVAYETQIFGLAQDTATLQEQSLTAQSYQLQQQLAQYQQIVNLLQETSGAVYKNGQWNIPAAGTTPSGGTFGIPGTNMSTDNSVNGQTVNINIAVPAGTDGSTLASQIVQAFQYQMRIGASS